jgi:protocatechuate 3,4-dioxygenase beta subunit
MTDHASSRGGRRDSAGGLLRRTPDQILGPYFPVGQRVSPAADDGGASICSATVPSSGRWRTGYLNPLSILRARPRFPPRIAAGDRGRTPAADHDLTVTPSGLRAQGEIVEVMGRVLNLDGEPVRGARLVLWQANSFGRYAHPSDPNPAPLDHDFIGFARLQSDCDGSYRIRTVKPGPYPMEPGWCRPPHIHFEVCGQFDRLVTQMYFPEEPENASDRVLMSASRPELLIAALDASTDGLGPRTLKFDIVLARG